MGMSLLSREKLYLRLNIMNNIEIKNKIIELSRGMASDSKKESYRCEY